MKWDLIAINKLLGEEDPLPPYTVVNFIGKPFAGKTLLALQTAWWIVHERGGSILYMDIDGSGDNFIQTWRDVFNLRYGFSPEAVTVHYLPMFARRTAKNDARVKHLYFDVPILEFFGIKARIRISEEGKATFHPEGQVKSQIANYSDVRVIIVDSFSTLCKLFSGTASFDGRARLTDWVYNELRDFALERKNEGNEIYFLVNHHVSINPQMGVQKIAGGSEVLHNSKYAYLLDKIKLGREEKKDYCRFYIYRYPNIPEFSKFCYLQYSDMGIIDVPEEDLKNLPK